MGFIITIGKCALSISVYAQYESCQQNNEKELYIHMCDDTNTL